MLSHKGSIHKKRKLLHTSEWKKLSFNVIVFDILTYIKFIIEPLKIIQINRDITKADLFCFGYFGLDKLRNIWFMFRSLDLSIDCPKSFLMAPRVIQNLTLWNFNVLRLQNIQSFPNLKKLKFIRSFPLLEGRIPVYDKFFSVFRFPNLVELKIHGSPHIHGKNWNKKNFLKLEKLSLNDLPNLNKELFTSVFFPKLKKIEIISCYNLKLIIDWTTLPSVKEFVTGSFSLLKNCKFQQLKTLQLNEPFLGIQEIKDKDLINLVSITIIGGFILDDLFERCLFTNLRTLYIDGTNDLTGKNWNQSLIHLEKIVMRNCRNMGDSLFQTHSFENLKQLWIDNCYTITGKDWDISVCIQLKQFLLINCKSFENDLFKHHKFKKGLLLVIRQCPLIDKKYKKTKNLNFIL